MPRILTVEDNAEMAAVIRLLVTELGHECDLAGTIAEAETKLRDRRYELITLDIRLPDGDGLEYCARLKRQRRLEAPVILLTTEVSSESVVRGLESGAADYLRKPIDPKELQARLRGHLRAAGANESRLEFRDLTVDIAAREVHYKGRKLTLRGRQFDILAHFLRRPEVVVTRDQLIAALLDSEIYDRTIDSHVSQLRSKLKSQHVSSFEIVSVYGVGYRLE